MNFKQITFLLLSSILTLLILQSCNRDTIYTQVIKNTTDHIIVLTFSGNSQYESNYTVNAQGSKTIYFDQTVGKDEATSMNCNLGTGTSITGFALVEKEGFLTDTLTLNVNLADASLWEQTSNEKGDIVVTCTVVLGNDKFN